MKTEYYSVEQAADHAKTWCERHPGWKRICDIENTDELYKTFSELSLKERRYWEKNYSDPEDAWLELGRIPCKVPFGFITGRGDFFRNITQVTINHNLMMVFKVSKT
jgi:hypothetical protein